MYRQCLGSVAAARWRDLPLPGLLDREAEGPRHHLPGDGLPGDDV